MDADGRIIGAVALLVPPHDNSFGVALLDEVAATCGLRLAKVLVDEGLKETVVAPPSPTASMWRDRPPQPPGQGRRLRPPARPAAGS
ncbi:hypothetical protein [Streptomyces sp. YGL11-2]|uniref:hypothetical protein n=1 Tax=Streptomyces sp. YGL11-2 TaxID=3414028 RepID=UPI003CE7681D